LHQAGEGLNHSASDGRDQVLDLGELAVVGQGLQLASQFAGNLLDRFGVEDLSGFGKGAESGSRAAESFLDALAFTGLLAAAQGGDAGVEEEQQQEGALLVEEQGAVAGAVPLGADAVEALEQGHPSVEVLQTDAVTVAEFASSVTRPTATPTQA